MSLRNVTILCCLIFLMASSVSAEPRTWKNKEGKTLTGELVSVKVSKEGKEEKKTEVVILKGEKEFTVKIDDLSDEDQEWVKELVPYVGMEVMPFRVAILVAMKAVSENREDPQKLAEAQKSLTALQSIENAMRKQDIPFSGTFYIFHVYPGSPAEKAGIQTGSLFTSVNGKTFKVKQPKEIGSVSSINNAEAKDLWEKGEDRFAVNSYNAWSESDFSKTRRYTIYLYPQNASLLRTMTMAKKTIPILPEWRNRKEEAEKEAKRTATEKEEAERIAAEKNAAERIAAEKFGKAVVEFIKPKEITVSETMDITEEEKTFAINFAQESIKKLRLQYTAFKDDPSIIKTTVEIPSENESKSWWTVRGSADTETTNNTIYSFVYKVDFSIEEGSPPKVEFARMGTLVLHENSAFTQYTKKIHAQKNAVKVYHSYITEEKKYDNIDINNMPNRKLVENAILIHAKRLFLGTQKIALHIPIDTSARAEQKLNEMTFKHLGNHIYEVQCKNTPYTKYSDKVYTDDAGKAMEKERREKQKKYVEKSLSGENRWTWMDIEKETMESIDEYAIPVEDGLISFTVRIQHHPDGEEGMAWTFIAPPQITQMQKMPSIW